MLSPEERRELEEDQNVFEAVEKVRSEYQTIGQRVIHRIKHHGGNPSRHIETLPKYMRDGYWEQCDNVYEWRLKTVRDECRYLSEALNESTPEWIWRSGYNAICLWCDEMEIRAKHEGRLAKARYDVYQMWKMA